MARYDDLNTSAIAYATLISSILLLVIILVGPVAHLQLDSW